MDDQFFDRPILNSPYEYPVKHWELDETGQPTHKIIEKRRPVRLITPIPKPRKQRGAAAQPDLGFGRDVGDDTDQQYDQTSIINEVRNHVDRWRKLKNIYDWRVTPETARLLEHWRSYDFAGIRPFFCQVEAVETIIWLTEVAPKIGNEGKKLLDYLEKANNSAGEGLARLALKLATGAGKTTVMAMIIAWQTVNAIRRPGSGKYTRGFLIVTPGITIKDRLRVLLPNDPDSYYKDRELVPQDMLSDLERAKIVITNYHAFKLRERIDISKGGKALLKGRRGEELKTLETEGQMLQRVMPELMGIKNIMVINDEAHHCYREKPEPEDTEKLKSDEKAEADKNNEAARLWISGLEIVNRKLGINRVTDLSATPFFLSGSGYAEGTLFPWTMSDFSLMDAIECGIVKLPRVPVADNIPGSEMPTFRVLWEHIKKDMPKKGRGKAKILDADQLPLKLQNALAALYGHYEKVYNLWKDAGINAPPCFIIVCNNTSTSKLVYDYISGYIKENADGTTMLNKAKLPLFSNFDEHENPYARPRTLLIDSEQLESGDALDKNFREMASEEIEQFRRDIIERAGSRQQADNITDQDLLREVMNTVGKEGKLGESVRCVVSVSMLSEGWDANTVTHVLGVRAFGTQLLCEQVIGRALRRQSYELNEENLFNVEYADVLGIPFDFTAKPVVVKPQPPVPTIQVKAVMPARDHLEIQFPRVSGYRVELPRERLEAEFTEDSKLILTPEIVGPTKVNNAGIIGQENELNLEHMKDMRKSSLIYHLAHWLLITKWRDENDEPKAHLFNQLRRITRDWIDNCLICKGSTYPAMLWYRELADTACERITAAITQKMIGEKPVRALLDPYNPTGSTIHVNFNTSKTSRYQTNAAKCHINWVILDSGWEGEFCRIVESHPRVKSYVKNHSLGFEVPYRSGSITRRYIPDFIVQIDDGKDELLNLIVEIKGYRGEDAKDKKLTMESYWVPGVNNLKKFGRWAFLEFTDVYEMEHDFNDKIESFFNTEVEKLCL